MRFLLLPLLLLGCASNPVKTATTADTEYRAETVAFALHNSYVIVAEQAATIAEQPDTPVEVKRTLVRLHDAASPAAKQLRHAAQTYNDVKVAWAAGTTTLEKVNAALAELSKVIVEASPKLGALAEAVGGAR